MKHFKTELRNQNHNEPILENRLDDQMNFHKYAKGKADSLMNKIGKKVNREIAN